LITGTISLEGKKKMRIGAFYHPPDKTDDLLEQHEGRNTYHQSETPKKYFLNRR
jgi:hypothetical protein